MAGFFEDYELGATHRTYARTITEGDHSLFCALVGYHVPLFIDEEYAKTTSFGGRICPSALVMSISTAMTEGLFREGIIALLAVEAGKFHLPVKIGDTIHTEVEVVAMKTTSRLDRGVVTFRDRVLNQRGEVVFEIDKITLIKRRLVA